jgi:hypothetical protein
MVQPSSSEEVDCLHQATGWEEAEATELEEVEAAELEGAEAPK